jgi:hypothetical protein
VRCSGYCCAISGFLPLDAEAEVPNKAPRKGIEGIDLRVVLLFRARGGARKAPGRVSLERVNRTLKSRERIKERPQVYMRSLDNEIQQGREIATETTEP